MATHPFLKNALPEPEELDDALLWRGPLGNVRLGPECEISIEDAASHGGDAGDAIVMAQCLLAAAQRVY